MSKLLISSAVATAVLSAGSFSIEDFIKNNVIKNSKVKVHSVKTIEKRKISGNNNWEAYLVLTDLTYKGKKVKEPFTVFVDEKGGVATMDLLDLKTGKEYRREIKPDMPESYYNQEHLISGSMNAKHKMVIFSDPQCPFCMEFVPKAIKDFNDKDGDVALYYYHMPLLQLHPVSDVLTRVMEVLQKEGRTGDALKIYGLKINPREKNADKILAAVKKQFGFDITKKQIEQKEIKDAVAKDVDAAKMMMISGTPTVYFDGKYDGSQDKYKKFLK